MIRSVLPLPRKPTLSIALALAGALTYQITVQVMVETEEAGVTQMAIQKTILPSLRGRIFLLIVLVGFLLLVITLGGSALLRQKESDMIGNSARRLASLAQVMAGTSTEEIASLLAGAQTEQANHQLSAVTASILGREPEVEGGFYTLGTDELLGYAFPARNGPGPKKDIPPRERPTCANGCQDRETSLHHLSW